MSIFNLFKKEKKKKADKSKLKAKSASKKKKKTSNKKIKKTVKRAKRPIIEKTKTPKISKKPKKAIKSKKLKTKQKKIIKQTKPAASKKISKEFDMDKIRKEIDDELKKGRINKSKAHVLHQRAPLQAIKRLKYRKGTKDAEYTLSGVPGFDDLFSKGIPKGNAVLVAGGAGSGKTIFCLQTLAYHSSNNEKCFYMSFEESEERLKEHMKEFGWDADKLIKSGKLKIKRYSPFEIARSVDGMLAKEKGELLIDLDPVILPKDFKPDFIVLDSLTAVASAFTSKEDSYRIYIEQLFRFFEKLGSTSFLITETEQIPKIFSTTGVEEFLADGVIVFYNLNREDTRESAMEVLKMRGEKHDKKIVAMEITSKGIVVYPNQQAFGLIEK